MKARTRLVAIGLVTFVVGLLLLFPARIAYHWFGGNAVTLAGIDGTIWSGSASQADVEGFYLHSLRWRIRPLSLFSGHLAYTIEASPVSGFLEGRIAIGLSGKVAAYDVKASLPLQAVQQLAAMPGLNGKLNAQLDRIEIEGDLPVAIDGKVEVAGLLVPIIDPSPIGGYRVEFYTQESGVMGTVEDTDGVVDVAGTIQIHPDRTYQFRALVAPKPNTPAHLQQQMKFLGTANERGQYEMRLDGVL
jgi:general secretion pathway protein N